MLKSKMLNGDAYNHQILCGLSDGFNALVMGATLGYTSSALLSMSQDHNFDITEEQGSWIGAIVPGMALIGSLSAGSVIESFGCRFVLLACSFPNLLTWLTIATANSVYKVILARCISGICLGFQQVGISIYLSETVNPQLRPVCSIFPAVLGALGFLVINLPPTIVSWRDLAYIGSAACIPLIVMLLYLPETPLFLLKKGKKEAAFNNLKWLRGSDDDAQIELKELISTGVDNKNAETTFRDLFRPPNKWPVCVSLLLFVFQQFTGISALTSFMGPIFEQAGSLVDPSLCSLIMTVVNIVVLIFASKLFAKYPRIYFIKYCSITMSVSLAVLCFYLKIRDSTGLLHMMSEYLTLVPLLTFTAFVLAFSLSWGPIPWMFIGDGLPLKVRGKCAALGVGTCWFFNFLVTKSFSWGLFYIGLWAVILVYILLTLLGWAVMTVYLPETFGFTPSQIDKYYEENYERKAKKA